LSRTKIEVHKNKKMLLIPWEYINEFLSLPNFTPHEIGEKLTYYGLETEVFTHENYFYFKFDTLPNRKDLLSWRGIVKEIGILLNCQIKNFNFPLINKSQKKPLKILINTNDCFEFYLGLIKNIEVKESSPQIKQWLKVNNINSINNIVDIANLVTLESGQPLHVFDYDSLLGEKEIIVRQALQGEIITSLKSEKLILGSDDLIISCGKKNIDLAGIVGAKETAITPQTKNILIECASFNPQSIKETTKRLNIFTLASNYFIRQTNLVFSPEQILTRIISLITESYQGNLDDGNYFIYKQKDEKTNKIISISQEFIEKKIGQKLPELIIENIWKQLNFSYQKKETVYYLTIPSYRSDINNEESVLEELLRIYDYNKITSSLDSEIKPLFFDDNNFNKKKKIRDYLVSSAWQEIITYSLISSEMKEETANGLEKNNFYQLLKPKNDYHKYYRQSLVSSHLKTIKYNLSQGNKNLLFFEISKIYNHEGSEELLILSGVGKIANQPLHNFFQDLDFYWIKGILENIFSLEKLEQIVNFSSSSLNYLSSWESSEIFLAKENIGFCGKIESQISKKYQINDSVFIAQISLTKIFNYLNKFPSKFSYKPISNFPISEKDLSFIFAESVNYNLVIESIKKNGGNDLLEVNMFDIYQSPEMKKNKQKSISFRLIFQSSVKTLENNEIEKLTTKITKKTEEVFNAKIRD